MNSVGIGFPMGMMPVPVDFEAKRQSRANHKRSNSHDDKGGHKKSTRSLSWLPHSRRHKSLSISHSRTSSFVGAPPGDSFGGPPYRKTSNAPSTPSIDTDSEHTASTLDSSSVATTPDMVAPSQGVFDVMLRSLSPDPEMDARRDSTMSWSDSVQSLLKETEDSFQGSERDSTLYWLNGLPESRTSDAKVKDDGSMVGRPLKDATPRNNETLQRLLLQLKDDHAKTTGRPKPIRWTMDGSGWRDEDALRIQTHNLVPDVTRDRISAASAASDGTLGPFHLERLVSRFQHELPDLPTPPLEDAIQQDEISLQTPPSPEDSSPEDSPVDGRPVPPPKNPARFRHKKRVQLPTIPEIMSKARTDDSGLVYFPGTVLSSASPSFRHGRIACHRRSSSKDSVSSVESSNSVASLQAMPTSIDLDTAVCQDDEMALADDMRRWFDDFGFESYGQLVPDFATDSKVMYAEASQIDEPSKLDQRSKSLPPIPVSSEPEPRVPMRFYSGTSTRWPGESLRQNSADSTKVIRMVAHPLVVDEQTGDISAELSPSSI